MESLPQEPVEIPPQETSSSPWKILAILLLLIIAVGIVIVLILLRPKAYKMPNTITKIPESLPTNQSNSANENSAPIESEKSPTPMGISEESYVYIKDVRPQTAGSYEIDLDYIQQKYVSSSEPEMDGYYTYINENPRIRTFTISTNPAISHGSEIYPQNISGFIQLFQSDKNYVVTTPTFIKVQNNVVTEISQRTAG